MEKLGIILSNIEKIRKTCKKVSRNRSKMFPVFNTPIISLNALHAYDSSQSAKSRSGDYNHPPDL